MNINADVGKWVALKIFKIETLIGSNKLYANGFQQIKMGITIEAVDIDNRSVMLSENEKASLQLINSRDGTPIFNCQPLKRFNEIPVNPSLGLSDWSRFRDEKLKYYPITTRSITDLKDMRSASGTLSRRHYEDVWLRTVSDSELHIAARITSDSGETFDSSDMAEGELTVSAVPPPVYKLADFYLRRDEIKEVGKPWKRVKYYYLGLKPRGEEIELSFFKMYPFSLYSGPPDTPFVDITGYTLPGESAIGYVINNPAYRPSKLIYPANSGGVVIVLVSVGNYGSAAAKDLLHLSRIRSSSISVRDIYGNSHKIHVRSTGALTMEDIELH